MTLIITDPAGVVRQAAWRRAARPASWSSSTSERPGRRLQIKVRGDNVNPSEHFTVTMISKFVCTAKELAQAGLIRNVLSANDTRDALISQGASSVSIRFTGASAGGANVSGSGNFSGVSVAAGAILYAASGGASASP